MMQILYKNYLTQPKKEFKKGFAQTALPEIGKGQFEPNTA